MSDILIEILMFIALVAIGAYLFSSNKSGGSSGGAKPNPDTKPKPKRRGK